MNIERIPVWDLFPEPMWRECPEVAKVVNSAADQDGMIFVTDDDVPYGHFTTYFGVILRRTAFYQGNPLGQRLFHLHELYHLSELKQWRKLWIREGSIPDWNSWSKYMINIELNASLFTECHVYIYIRGLREMTRESFLNHTIWMDRFEAEFIAIHTARHQTMEELNLDKLFETLLRERIRAMTSPRFNDFIEQQIEGYRQTNWTWASIWAKPVSYGDHGDTPAFQVVELAAARGQLDETERLLREFLRKAEDSNGIPFGTQADLFSAVMHETYERLGNHLLRIGPVSIND
ncbi:hypothetical protein HQ487_05225 [Candidatus Uhrbacteria bacterium]|nr:hypothetical protein [Candidatus Uhrbacteria bacterium]